MTGPLARTSGPIAAIVAALLTAASSTAFLKTDPAKSLARVRLNVVATAPITDITFTGVTLASYTSVVLAGAGGASETGSTLRTSNASPGQRVETQFDMILADVVAGGSITWTISTTTSADTSVEVYSTNDPKTPQLVDRFEATAASSQFKSDTGRLTSSDALNVSPFAPPLVLAEYYPWYTLDGWQSSQFGDRPAQLYSSDSQSDVDRQVTQAKSANIDAFVVSWQGRTNVENDRRMRLVLDSAARAGIRACVYFETYIVNPTNDANLPVDPATMVQWLEDAVDMYGSHPAYLRVNGRPVIFIYLASSLNEFVWADILTAVRRTGRNPIVIGDFYHSRLITALDGEYQYINVSLSPADLIGVYHTETLRVRTWNLAAGGARRIWVASACPGYDDRLLTARSQHSVVDRANGGVYDTQWSTAVAMAADWIIITTWNEFFENTEIEPSVRYGTSYLDQTRTWAAKFKTIVRAPHASASSPSLP
ncbi:MAG TPA: endo-1,3-alpha-glucanase family glycosylhydrolase [Vicinamibacterales bacterium]